MYNISGTIRTAKVFPLKTEQKPDGKGGTYTAKSIMFVGMSKRRYKQTVYDENGQPKLVNGVPTKERKSDPMLFKATGELAQIISDFAYLFDANQKIISRHIEFRGQLETYRKDEVVDINQNVIFDGQTYPVTFQQAFTQDKSIIMLDFVEFLDPKPDILKQIAPTTSQTIVTTTPAPSQPVITGQNNITTSPSIGFTPSTGVNPESDCPF